MKITSFWVEAELRGRLGDLGGALHTARSRNDNGPHPVQNGPAHPCQPSDAAGSDHLTKALTDKAEAEADTLIVAYTHGQPAQPSTFGHYLAAAIEVLIRDAAPAGSGDEEP